MNPLHIVTFDTEEKAILHLENLQSVLDHEEVRNRRVAVISIAGVFRRGKSFFLNYLLRYLKTKGDKSFTADDKLFGFDAKFGVQRVTTGISIWPEVFIIDNVAVVLIDSQGTFDKDTSMKVNTAIVAFSSLISSVQIFNFHELLNSQDFTNLQFFIKYGELLQQENFNQNGAKFFQKILFLIRDWNEGYGFSYGYDGGQRYLQNFVSSSTTAEMKSSHEMLRTCFDEVHCYLLPHPGDDVSLSNAYIGHLKDIDGDFLDHIHSLASSLLSPGNLVPKRIAGVFVTSGQLLHHIQACVSMFNSNELPEPKTMYNILVDEVSGSNIKEAREMYCKLMKEATDNKILEEEQMHEIHQEKAATAMEYFTNKQKMGSQSQKKKYAAVLHEHIQDDFLRLSEIMRHQREIQNLKLEMEKHRAENKKINYIVQQMKIDITKKEEEIYSQAQAIKTLQKQMHTAEKENENLENALKLLTSQLEQMKKFNEEQKGRNEELKTLLEEQSQKMKQLEDELKKKMKDGFFTKCGRFLDKICTIM